MSEARIDRNRNENTGGQKKGADQEKKGRNRAPECKECLVHDGEANVVDEPDDQPKVAVPRNFCVSSKRALDHGTDIHLNHIFVVIWFVL